MNKKQMTTAMNRIARDAGKRTTPFAKSPESVKGLGNRPVVHNIKPSTKVRPSTNVNYSKPLVKNVSPSTKTPASKNSSYSKPKVSQTAARRVKTA